MVKFIRAKLNRMGRPRSNTVSSIKAQGDYLSCTIVEDMDGYGYECSCGVTGNARFPHDTAYPRACAANAWIMHILHEHPEYEI